MTQTFRFSSDWHLEFYTYRTHIGSPSRDINQSSVLQKTEGEDKQILLLAGDIFTAKTCDNWIHLFDNLCSRFQHIYMILGNHEHYGYNFNRTYDTVNQFILPFHSKMTLLDDEYVEINKDTALFAGTMWSSYHKDGNFLINDQMIAKQMMNDYRVVEGFSPEMARLSFEKCKNLLDKYLTTCYTNKIVMTHHAPSYQSVHPRFVGSALNSSFVNDLDDYIKDSDIHTWLHGHIHNNVDYRIGSTRILANPYGYYSENPTDYNRNLTFTI